MEKRHRKGKEQGTVGVARPTLRALLIGVRGYPLIPPEYGQPLAGCHNDVERMRETLLEWEFPADEIRVLVDPWEGCGCGFCLAGSSEPATGERSTPTRDGIAAAVDELLASTKSDDIVVIYYSGHGSEFSGRGLLAGRRFQTLVPHDSGRGESENRDISDREIKGWIRDFQTRTPYLTLIFDCCHSGGLGNLRGAPEPGGRRVRAEERPADEAFSPAGIGRLSACGDEDAGSWRGPSGWLRGSGGSAILLSASAARELSSETVVDGKKHGLFTHQLARALGRWKESGPERGDPTWAEIFPEIAEGVTRENLSQHPRREGNAPIFGRGEIDTDDVYPPDVVELEKLAVVIGIDYRVGDGEGGRNAAFAPLRTPRSDAQEIARVLEQVQGYEIVGSSQKRPGPLLNERATRRAIHKVIDRLIRVKARTKRETAVLIYFAGHGVTRTGQAGEVEGFLVPWGADPEDPSTWLPMKDLRDQLVDGIRDAERLSVLEQKKPLARLTSRHLLLVLDCCFGGALSFDFFRGGEAPERPVYYSEYKRFVEGSAWQLLTSASYSQQAMDRNPRNPDQRHSPFAEALIEGLTSDRADQQHDGGRGDHIVTAAELHQFIDRRLQRLGVDVQTPGLMPLRPVEGQFIFRVPGFLPSPLPDPPLDPAANPWRGDLAYDGSLGTGPLFCGRELATLELLEHFLVSRGVAGETTAGEQRPVSPVLVVRGVSGSGKTSLVRAGLVPILEDPVGERERYRSFAGRRGLRRFLISHEDLLEIREWAEREQIATADELAAGVAQSHLRVARRVRDWAVSSGFDLVAPGGATAQLQMEHLGIPSFSSSEEAGGKSWVSRVGLLALLDSPEELASHLRLWLAEGGLSDFFSLADRALRQLVGEWDIGEWPAESVAGHSLAEGAGGANSIERRKVWLIDRAETLGAGAMPWFREVSGAGDRIVATASPTWRPALGDSALRWIDCFLPRPTRAELREVIEAPASARVLFFAPPELVGSLVEEVLPAPAPLPLLSLALARMFERAWIRRRDSDRQLTPADLGAGGVAGVLAERAEACYRRLATEPVRRRLVRQLFLRAILLGDGNPRARPVAWRELAMADRSLRRLLFDEILPVLQQERVVVSGAEQVELACTGLLVAWPRLRRWIGRAGSVGLDPQAAWRRALEWEAGAFDRGKLWSRDAVVHRLVRRPELNCLERAFLLASDMEQRSTWVKALAARAMGDFHREWSRNTRWVVLAAESTVDLCRSAQQLLAEPWDQPLSPKEGRDPVLRDAVASKEARERILEARDSSRKVVEQVLHHLLATTPFSVPLIGPGDPRQVAVQGLAFDDAGGLRVRVPGRVWRWRLQDLAADPEEIFEAESPAPGEGEVRPKRRWIGRDQEFPAAVSASGARAHSGHDTVVRYLPPRRGAPPFLPVPWGNGPIPLLGHRGVPRFLAFSPCGKWLASAAGIDDAGGEVRVWPLQALGGLPAQPRSIPGCTLGEAFPEGAMDGIGNRVTHLDRVPADWWVDGEIWQIERLAWDGSSFDLRRPATGEAWTLELMPQARSGKQRKGALGLPPPPRPGRPPVPLGRLPVDAGGLREIIASPDGRWLAAVGEHGAAALWSFPDLELRWSAYGQPASGLLVETLCFAADSLWMAAVGKDGSARVWSLPELGPFWSTSPESGPQVRSLAFHPRSDNEVLLAAGTASGQPWLIRRDGCESAPESGPGGRISCMVFSPDGRRLALGDLDGSVSLWHTGPGVRFPVDPVVLGCPHFAGLAVRAMAFAADSGRLAVERQAVFEPFSRRVDIYRLDLDDLIRLASGHAGGRAGPMQLPPELAPGLAARRGDPQCTSKRERRVSRDYVELLGLATTERAATDRGGSRPFRARPGPTEDD